MVDNSTLVHCVRSAKKTEKKLMLGEVEAGLVGEDRQLGLDKVTEVRIG